MSFWTHKEPKARKQHQCDLCGEPIEKGEIYSYGSGMAGDADAPYTWKEHLACQRLGSAYMKATKEDTYRPEYVQEWAHEQLGRGNDTSERTAIVDYLAVLASKGTQDD